MELTGLAVQLDALLGELAEHRAKWLSGRAEALRTSAIYGTHADVLDAALVGPLQSGGEAARPYLNAVVRVQLEGGVAPVSDKLMDALDGEILRDLADKWYFRDTDQKIAEECNRKHRKVYDQSQRRVLARMEPILLERQQAIHTLMVDRGFGGYQAMCQALSGINHADLLDDVDGLLDDSKPVYMKHLGEALRAAGVFPDDARTHDLRYLWAGHFDLARRFPELIATVTDTFSALGLDPRTTAGLTLDLDQREGKRPGIHLTTGADTVYLHITPVQEWEAFPNALGAFAAAMARASVPAEADFASRALWNGTVETAYRMLFASLAGNREWLERFCPRIDADVQVTRYHLWWLYQVRLLGGGLKYARFLHGPGEMMDKADGYEHYLYEAIGARVERDYYLWNTPDFLDQAVQLQGHFLGAQLLDTVTDRFGEGWFADPAAGAFIRGLWAVGGADVAAVADGAGIDDPCDIWPLTERLEGVLGSFEGDD